MWLKQLTQTIVRIGPIVDSALTADVGIVVTEITLTKNGTSAALTTETFASTGSGFYDLTLTTTNTNTTGRLTISCTKAARSCPPLHLMVLPGATFEALVTNAAGAANGLFIAGTNAATTITSSTGSALTLSSTGNNGHALSATGNGTGNGFYLKGGATGDGLHTEGGATSGEGIDALAAAGNGCGIKSTGFGTGDGICGTGGATGRGIAALGGPTSGDGLVGTATVGHGIRGIGVGSAKHGILGSAAATANAAGICGIGSTHATGGPGLLLTGGSTAGEGIKITTTSGDGILITAAGSGKHGIFATGGSSGNGMQLTGGASGVGLEVSALGTTFLVGINNQVVDGLTVDQLANSVAAISTQPTMAQAVYAIHQFLVASSISGTTVTVKDNQSPTPQTLETFTINSSTAPTSITRAT